MSPPQGQSVYQCVCVVSFSEKSEFDRLSIFADPGKSRVALMAAGKRSESVEHIESFVCFAEENTLSYTDIVSGKVGF